MRIASTYTDWRFGRIRTVPSHLDLSPPWPRDPGELPVRAWLSEQDRALFYDGSREAA